MLDFDPVWLPTMIVSFLVFMVILNNVLIKPLLRVVDERNGKITTALDEARAAEARFQETLERVEAELAASRIQAKDVIEGLRAEGQAEQQKLLAEANRQAEEANRQAKVELEAAVAAARGRLESDADALASGIVGKLVGRA